MQFPRHWPPCSGLNSARARSSIQRWNGHLGEDELSINLSLADIGDVLVQGLVGRGGCCSREGQLLTALQIEGREREVLRQIFRHHLESIECRPLEIELI